MSDHGSSLSSPIPKLLETKDHFSRLRTRFNRLSKQRRLLTCLLLIFAIIMCGLLIGIFILSWAIQVTSHDDRYMFDLITEFDSSTFWFSTQTTTLTSTTSSTTKPFARYGESCDYDSDCERPFLCYRKGSSSAPGMCRCPLKYDFIKDRCVGDLNAMCNKDQDCQQFMICQGMDDGTRRCQCLSDFNYDNEQKRCRGEYLAPCETKLDCHGNLICNKTGAQKFCSCDFHYQYYPTLRKCRGDPGAVCERATAECVDNAECRDGACECSNQFIPNENKVCFDPCPTESSNAPRIRYPGNCRRFIDCQQKSKTECPEMTIFNLHTQLCDYPKNVHDC